MKFGNTEVWGFEHAFRGLRNPMNSWGKSDSKFNDYYDVERGDIDFERLLKTYPNAHIHHCNINGYYADIIGEADMKLAQNLIKAGNEHRKFMRQIFVSVDITAPLYWWKEFDTYKVGTTSNSTSTMHKLASTPITMDCFETDDYDKSLITTLIDGENDNDKDEVWTFFSSEEPLSIIDWFESLRLKYNETKDIRYWKELIRFLPESWLQTRTIAMNYENIRNMYFQRRNHKLTEWSKSFVEWVESLPYAKELIMYEG